ncbi:hypothetical protein ACFWGC_25980 [Cytobacillus pseudoceanisediminis]|uniref:hypothetical protein n=1 Tax=Cytobacillus pseudoceanisediminis TaxID=3051614 RepID=UPI00364E70F0
MSSKIEEEVAKTGQKNLPIATDNTEEVTVENVEISKEQKDILENMDKTTEEAVLENELNSKKEIPIIVPKNKSEFKDPDEFSQYISSIFFSFYKGDLSPEDLLDHLIRNGHPDYLAQLPKERKNQIATLEFLQQKYTEQLKSPIVSYAITDLQYQQRAGEAVFYRKYILENQKEIYSISILKKKGDTWLLFDDGPSAPYVIADFKKQDEGVKK